MRSVLVMLTLSLIVHSSAVLAEPQMGGEMKHIFVVLSGNTVFLSVQGDANERLWLQEYDETYTAPADVLNGTRFNSRYGWLAQGFWQPPSGAGMFIEVVDQTPGLLTYEAFTYTPIFGTDGAPARWHWSTMMVHNWYAAEECGKYNATYKVYVGDLETGDPVEGYNAAYITLHWQFVPDPEITDIDGDLDTDLVDFAAFQTCYTEDIVDDMAAECGCFDYDGDDDVDEIDFETWQVGVNGPDALEPAVR